MTRIMMMKMGAPKVFAFSPLKPALIKSSENAEEATVPPIKWLTVQLWETLAFLNDGIEGDLPPYCGLDCSPAGSFTPIGVGSDRLPENLLIPF
ncbi:hypothetical protein [Limnobacter sp.]|uniref:hypothetical protein n=1 Tax=Limnobacter sp. TaxID=2003368 RepID=UPI002736127D|nr:hypothetical protein [Limnobacter sp.]